MSWFFPVPDLPNLPHPASYAYVDKRKDYEAELELVLLSAIELLTSIIRHVIPHP